MQGQASAENDSDSSLNYSTATDAAASFHFDELSFLAVNRTQIIFQRLLALCHFAGGVLLTLWATILAARAGFL